jgi:hypothetical protein
MKPKINEIEVQGTNGVHLALTPSDTAYRQVAEDFLAFLLGSGPVAKNLLSKIQGNNALRQKMSKGMEFRAETTSERKKRLRPLREKLRRGRLSPEERQQLEALERSAVYSNMTCYMNRQKMANRKTHNDEESKRLYVAALLCRYLKHSPPASTGAAELRRVLARTNVYYEEETLRRRVRRFAKSLCLAGENAFSKIIIEQFELFKYMSVMNEYENAIMRIETLPPENWERRCFQMRLGALMAFTPYEHAFIEVLVIGQKEVLQQ